MNYLNACRRALPQIMTSGRIVLASMAICSLLYPLVILGIGRVFTPRTAEGSLVRNGLGEIIGSELLAQGFSRPEYLWPRPSAVDYNAAASGGSNLSPTSPNLGFRAQAISTGMSVIGEKIPADLVTASGSGLDPHITLRAAEYQAARIAAARGLSVIAVQKIIREQAKRPGGALSPEPLVNVLLLNLALDGLDQ